MIEGMLPVQPSNGPHHTDISEPFDLSTSVLIHDLNNLLTTVISHSMLALAKTEHGNVARPHIERTVQAAKYAAALSRQLNLYAKNDLNTADTTDLNQLISEITNLLEPVFLKHIKVHLQLTPDLPTIHISRFQIQQITMNLLINAAEAIPNGNGDITITTGQETIRTLREDEGHQFHFAPKPGHYITLQVTDNGVGMSERVLADLLIPYFTTKPRGRGLGLMSVIKTLNEWAGGLTIKSRPNIGSTFTIYFPCD